MLRNLMTKKHKHVAERKSMKRRKEKRNKEIKRR
jgi:hypothetical protein